MAVSYKVCLTFCSSNVGSDGHAYKIVTVVQMKMIAGFWKEKKGLGFHGHAYKIVTVVLM